MLHLPIHDATLFVLVQPHYPENVGAAARAIKTMGFARLVLVKPSRLAVPEHEMAHKMAVKALDVLERAECYQSLDDALAGSDLVYATTSHRGISGVLTPRQAAPRAILHAKANGTLAIVFGNEKTGLSVDDLALAQERVRIPMAADQPSINLAQATQVIAYELFLAALELRNHEQLASMQMPSDA